MTLSAPQFPRVAHGEGPYPPGWVLAMLIETSGSGYLWVHPWEEWTNRGICFLEMITMTMAMKG